MTNAWPYTCLTHTFQEQKMTKGDISLTTVASYAFNPKKQKQQHIITPIKKKKKKKQLLEHLSGLVNFGE